MSYSACTIRNYLPADHDGCLRLCREALEVEPAGTGRSPRDFGESLRRPGFSPPLDIFVVEAGGGIVGYLDVTLELAIGSAVLGCWLHPGYRGQGLAARLSDCALRRAREMGASLAQVIVPGDNAVAQKVLSRLGFRVVRRFLEVRLNMDELSIDDTRPDNLLFRHLEPGEEPILARLQNRCFAGSWGYNPNTVEEISYRLSLDDCSPGDVILADDGDRPVGYCWTRVLERRAAGKSGQVYMLGVDPDYRGRDIGRAVLLVGLSCLRDKGLPDVQLTVDSENEVARALYRSVGFRVFRANLWYEKETG